MRTLAKRLTAPTGARSSGPDIGSVQLDPAHAAPGAARGAASGEEGPRLSRRSMVAALAGGVVPVAPALAAGEPDAELIKLGRHFLDLVKLEAAADEARDRCIEAGQWPEPPVTLRHRLEDHIGGLCLPLVKSLHRKGLSANPSLNRYYVEAEVKSLRRAPAPRDPDQRKEQRARIAEIEREYQTWSDRCSVAGEAAGVDVAEAAVEEIRRAINSVVRRIAALRATTLAGMRVRALVISDMVTEEVDEPEDVLMISAMIRDLLSIEVA